MTDVNADAGADAETAAVSNRSTIRVAIPAIVGIAVEDGRPRNWANQARRAKMVPLKKEKQKSRTTTIPPQLAMARWNATLLLSRVKDGIHEVVMACDREQITPPKSFSPGNNGGMERE